MDIRNRRTDSVAFTKQEFFAEIAKYPDPPQPFGGLFETEIPSVSAIYFLHNKLGIEYVGKSIDLRKRIGGLNALSHHAVEDKDLISWIEFPDEDLEFVECYYIWLCRPARNFGRKDDAFYRRAKGLEMLTTNGKKS